MVRFGPDGKIQTTLSESPNGWQDAARAPAVIRHPAGDGGAAGSRGIEFADGRVVQLLADVNLVFGVPGVGRLAERNVAIALLERAREIDNGHVARDIVHDVAAYRRSSSTMPRGFLPVGICSTRVGSAGSFCTVAAPVSGSNFSFTTMLLAALMT